MRDAARGTPALPFFFRPKSRGRGAFRFVRFVLPRAHALASRSLVDPPPPYRARDDGTDVWVRSRPDVRGRYYYCIHPTGVAPDPNRGPIRGTSRVYDTVPLRHLSGALSDAGCGREPPASGGGFAFCPDPVASRSTRLRSDPGDASLVSYASGFGKESKA